ncbi:MAG: 4-hydroxy-tetrahydrodipicolinate reductase [Deltaproteobacteria bacterium]|nr:4-hydroxy-tetrahydrodipicolinate reductase [Deltaproteobacteria bacterium]
MIRALITGAAGRMGGQILRLASETPGLLVVGALERAGHPAVGRDAGEVAGVGTLGVPVTDDLAAALPGADVVIDFTSATASLDHVDAVCRAGKAIVIGSTGFSADQRASIQRRAAEARVFLTANMSVGVNVLLKVVADVARLLGDDYDVEIIETHHRFKKDAPSGTALALAESVAEGLGRDLSRDAVYGRQGLVGERTPREIGIHAVRAGDVVGDHTVIFGALGERVEIAHKATSRETFARGALRAALWLPGQAKGLYDMRDVLGLR